MEAFVAPFVFFGGIWLALTGVILWGIEMGAQGSLLRSLVAAIVPPQKRGTGFGLFDTVFGISWLAGSWVMGILYERSLWGLVVFPVLLQLLALPLFVIAHREQRSSA